MNIRQEIVRIMNQEPDKERDQQRIDPIGLILYGKNEMKLAAVGVQDKTFLKTLYISRNDLPKSSQIDLKSGRVLHFPDYEEMQIVQANIGSIDIESFSTIQLLQKRIRAQFHFRNPSNNNEEYVMLGEKQIVGLMTGKKGGVALMEDGLDSEDAALIIEQDYDGQKTALFALLYPEDTKWGGLDSSNGAFEFFKRLNSGFIQEGLVPKQFITRLSGIEKYLERKGRYNSKQFEIWKSYMIGQIRQAYTSEDQVKLNSLHNALYKIPTSWFDRFLYLSESVEKSSAKITSDIASLKRGLDKDSQQTLALEKTRNASVDAIDRVVDYYIRELGSRMGTDKNVEIQGLRKDFFLKLVDLANSITDLEGLKELQTQLRRLGSDYYMSTDTITIHSSNDEELTDPYTYKDENFSSTISVIKITQAMNKIEKVLQKRIVEETRRKSPAIR